MFVSSDDTINVVIFFKKDGSHYIVYNEKDFLKLKLEQEQIKEYTKVKFLMRQLTWGLYNALQEYATIEIGKGKGKIPKKEWNFFLYKEIKLKTLIIGWDLKGVPFSQDAIMNLAPEVAEVILDTYDSFSTLNDLDEEVITKQIHGFVMAKGRTSNASIGRLIMENDLIEEFHWMPQDVAKIPYKKLQEFFLVRKTKAYARQSRAEMDKFTSDSIKKTNPRKR
jgi:hypothetical protein